MDKTNPIFLLTFLAKIPDKRYAIAYVIPIKSIFMLKLKPVLSIDPCIP
jgi:hypothetical protein